MSANISNDVASVSKPRHARAVCDDARKRERHLCPRPRGFDGGTGTISPRSADEPGYDKYRRDYSKLIWETASTKWSFDDATFDRSAAPIASANSKLRGAEEGEGRASGRAATVNRCEKPAACRTPRSVGCGAPASSESCGTSSKAACEPSRVPSASFVIEHDVALGFNQLPRARRAPVLCQYLDPWLPFSSA